MTENVEGKFDPIPRAPEWIAKDRYAYERWIDIWPVLDASRITPDRNGDIVALYCQTYAQLRRSGEDLAEQGYCVPKVEAKRNTDGSEVTKTTPIANPNAELMDAGTRRLAELAKMIGLRPDAPLVRLNQRYKEIVPGYDGYDHDAQPAGADPGQPGPQAGLDQ